MTTQQDTGTHGETLAADYLTGQGYTLITRNWHCRQGELDLVMRQGELLVFVEVRTRHAETTESAFASVQPPKQQRLIAAIHAYLDQHNSPDAAWRLDLIAVALPWQGAPIIEHVEDALDW